MEETDIPCSQQAALRPKFLSGEDRGRPLNGRIELQSMQSVLFCSLGLNQAPVIRIPPEHQPEKSSVILQMSNIPTKQVS